MTKTKYIVIHNNSYEYDIFVTDTKKGLLFEMHYSEEEFWTRPGTLIMTMLDTGNGVKFSHAKKSMEYDIVEEIRILLNFSKSINDNKVERESRTFIYPEGSSLQTNPISL